MEYRTNPAAKGVVIDWETSGNDWESKTVYDLAKKYQGISYGMVVFDTTTLEPLDTLYREIRFDGSKYGWDAEAEAIHGLSQAYLEMKGVAHDEAAMDMAEMILKHFTPQEPILFLGHNTEYDKAFTEQLLEPYNLMFKIHNTHLDTSGTAYLNFGLHRSDDVFHFLGLPQRKEHNALEDCIFTLEAAKRMRVLMTSALQQLHG